LTNSPLLERDHQGFVYVFGVKTHLQKFYESFEREFEKYEGVKVLEDHEQDEESERDDYVNSPLPILSKINEDI